MKAALAAGLVVVGIAPLDGMPLLMMSDVASGAAISRMPTVSPPSNMISQMPMVSADDLRRSANPPQGTPK